MQQTMQGLSAFTRQAIALVCLLSSGLVFLPEPPIARTSDAYTEAAFRSLSSGTSATFTPWWTTLADYAVSIRYSLAKRSTSLRTRDCSDSGPSTSQPAPCLRISMVSSSGSVNGTSSR